MATAYPRYKIPRRVLLDLAIAVLTGGRRSFRAQSLAMMTGIRPPLRLLGAEHIPQGGPGLITCNHYFRPGFWAPWFSTAISAAVPVDMYWTMADAFTYPGYRLGRLYRFLSHLLLVNVARVYGFNSMPPMPPLPGEEAQRAASIRRLVSYVRAHPDALPAVAPEGGDQPGGILRLPPDGFGRLALAFARLNMPFYPVGVFEEDGCFTVQFGAPYRLALADSSDRAASDLQARQQVMLAIARCLPRWLRGEFVE